jgi:hypothetical protein
MRVDLYTKLVLTVIAMCLVRMSLQTSLPVVHAQADSNGIVHVAIEENRAISEVRIRGVDGVLPVGLMGTSQGPGGAWSYETSVPIAAYKPLPVGLEGTSFDAKKKSWDYSQAISVQSIGGERK